MNYQPDLSQLDSLLQTVVEGANDAVMITSSSLDDPLIVYVNPAFCRMSGYTAEELVGKATPRILQGTETDRNVLYRLRAALEKGEPFQARTVNYRKDGSPYFVEWRIIPARNSDGAITHFISFQRDVTSEETSRKEIRRQEDLYRSLARILPNSVVLLFDRDLRFLIVEGGGTGGFASQFHEGKTLAETLSPEKLPFLETVCRNALDGATASYQLEYFGTAYQLYTQPIASPEGEIFAGMIVAQDITAFKRVQDELNERVEQLTILQRVEAELAAQLNTDYVLTMALDSAVRLSQADAGFIALLQEEQWTSAKFIGDYPQVTVTAFLKRGMGVIARVVRQQQAEWIEDVNLDLDYIAILPHTVSQIAVPLISRDKLVGVLSLETSKPGRFTARTLDFTKLMMARVAQAIDNAQLYQQTASQLEELQMLYGQVTRLEQLKTDMIRIASHDLRNPLSVVMSYGNMLKNELRHFDGTNTAYEYTDNIEQAALQMRKIILNILSLERIEEAAKTALFDACDLGEIARQSFDEQRSAAALKSQIYELQIEAGKYCVNGDPVQLHEAIANLIGNAIKYTRDQGAIQVSLTQNADTVIFKVVDNGYGIKEAQQSRLFQPFFRARTPETRDIEGSGLGLHLVRNIIERHGGTMIFHSIYGEGSTFGFELKRMDHC
jgi:PAS domain S-box-containing protein